MTPELANDISLFCRFGIGAAFAVSAVAKLADPSGFRSTVKRFKILPEGISRPASWLLILGEVAIVSCMAVGGRATALAFAAAAAFLVLFQAALISVLTRRIETSCGCFGQNRRKVSYFDIARNAGLLLLAGTGWIVTPFGSATSPGVWQVGVIAVPAVLLVILWINLPDVYEALRQV